MVSGTDGCVGGRKERRLRNCTYGGLLPDSIYIHDKHTYFAIGVDIFFTQQVFTVDEANETLEVCMHIVSPGEGLECEVMVSLLLKNGTASKFIVVNYALFVITFWLPPESEEDFSNDATLSVLFTANMVYACVDITIINDDIVEENQEFLVKVGSIDCEGYPPLSLPPPTRVVIIDDDG